MTPTISWPSELPAPQIADKSGTTVNPQVSTPLASGRTRVRLAFDAVPVDWVLSFVMTDAQARLFERFYRVTLGNGVEWFWMEIDLPAGRGPYPFRIMGAPPQPERLGTKHWRYNNVAMQQWLRAEE